MFKRKAAGILLSIALTLGSGVIEAKIYTWTDEQGQVHFGDKALPGQQEVKIQAHQPDWKKAVIHITDAGAGLTDEERERITQDINAIYRFYDEKLYFDIYKTVPVNIHLFGQLAQYQAYIAAHQAISENSKSHLQTKTYGVYIRQTDEIAVYLRDDREATFRTIKHEISHAQIDTIAPDTPRWLNEGIAENMETLKGSSEALYLEQHPTNFRSLLHHKARGGLMPIDQFLTLESHKWASLNRNSDYALQTQSGELVRLLLSTEPGMRFVSRLLHNYKRGDRTLAYYLVDKDYFGGLSKLRLNWSFWIDRKQPRRILL